MTLLNTAPIGDRASLDEVRCNLCDRNEFRILYDRPAPTLGSAQLGDFVASTDRFDAYGRIVRCRNCGLVYTNPRPPREAIAEGYRRVVDDEYVAEDSSRSINAHMCLHTIKRFAKQGRLLDVGCSTGYFLNAARLDFATVGIEPSEWAGAFARDHLRLEVLTGTLEDVALPGDSFDVVVLNDVIEHLTNPRAALLRVKDLLRPGGLLYAVTPDIESVSARLLRSRWWGLRPAHIYYFSPRTLTALLRETGFEVQLLKSYGRIFTWGYWLSRLKNYPRLVHRAVGRVVGTLHLENKFLYIDTRDSMEVCARRR